MKRWVRILASALTVLALCGSLCGCVALDEARAGHAFWTEEGHIRLGESVYKKLPSYWALAPLMREDTTPVYVTEPDVPVLLREQYGSYLRCSKDGVFLQGFFAEQVYFCREDRYAEVLSQIEAGFLPDSYGYSFFDYDPETGTSEEVFYQLTAAERAAVDNVLNTVTPQTFSINDSRTYDYAIRLEECAGEGLFRRYLIDVEVQGETYHLVKEQNEELLVYTVPPALSPHFKNIFQVLVDSDEAWRGAIELKSY